MFEGVGQGRVEKFAPLIKPPLFFFRQFDLELLFRLLHLPASAPLPARATAIVRISRSGSRGRCEKTSVRGARVHSHCLTISMRPGKLCFATSKQSRQSFCFIPKASTTYVADDAQTPAL